MRGEHREINSVHDPTNMQLDDLNGHLVGRGRRIDELNKRLDETYDRIDELRGDSGEDEPVT